MGFEGFEANAVCLTWPSPGVALATMTRAGEMNTLHLDLIAELGRAIDEAQENKARALILTGSGRAFCCGAHLKYFDKDVLDRFDIRDNYLNRIALLFDRIEAISIPVIAAINGYAMGGGCEMALACDFRIMATGATMALPEVKLGATPGAGGVQKLAKYCGRGKATEVILLAQDIGCDYARELGLLYASAPPEGLLDAALDLAAQLKKFSPMAIGQCKASIHISEDCDLRTARRFGLEALSNLIGSPDWEEGIDAFHNKRTPEFS